jgi:N-acetylmuramoyl-L-alanine amidase
LSAERVAEVSLRFGRQDNLVKIVIEADEEFVLNAITASSVSGVRINFPGSFNLQIQKDFMYETSRKDHVLMISLKDISDIRTYRLSAPARIVIDLKIIFQGNVEKPEQKQQAQPDARRQPGDALQQTGKSVLPAPQHSAQRQADPNRPPEGALKFKTVALDPGHGGYDYGIFRQETREKEINLNIARELGNLMQKKGFRVFLTRRADQYVSLEERIGTSNTRHPDLFLGIHATDGDKFVITTATADESAVDAAARLYRLSLRQNRHIEKSRAAAKSLGEAIKAEFKTDVIYRELPLPVLTSLDSPAILIEYPLADRKSYQQKDRERIINSVAKGLTISE